jgi:Flp pilus assembly protein TadG
MCSARRYRRPVNRLSFHRDRPVHLQHTGKKHGVAVVELAVLLPLLALLFVIAVDCGRVFYFSLTLQNCARAGALYASDPHVADESPFDSVEEAALSDATNLSPAPTITTQNGTDALGRGYVEVTAAYTYRSITQFPGIPHVMNLTRMVRMYPSAIIPDPS